MRTLVLTHMDRWNAFGFGRGGGADAMGHRGVSATVAAASVRRERRESFTRAHDRFDRARIGRSPLAESGAALPAAAPIGHRVDITA